MTNRKTKSPAAKSTKRKPIAKRIALPKTHSTRGRNNDLAPSVTEFVTKLLNHEVYANLGPDSIGPIVHKLLKGIENFKPMQPDMAIFSELAELRSSENSLLKTPKKARFLRADEIDRELGDVAKELNFSESIDDEADKIDDDAAAAASDILGFLNL